MDVISYTEELFKILDAEADRSDLLKIADAQRLIISFGVMGVPIEDARKYLRIYIQKIMPRQEKK